ncbi:hypothetical protein CBS63078_7057 [Aspergillus niger]|uniref:Uncharacterized protein n=6 Tax=Aspergillus TaxID=5052 RepID=A2QBK1_ASPNC|nr:hypothetical protein An02g00330 [Aspergillus niger]XP_026625129.1 hypothetical protein BDQ94DRAFT_171367 [Aspergillus welwitschiae]EHA22569.1 hypothetical protein ASPNIDRAFT_36613 [Aspergillus niger ATCC 1015]RDH24966.1 hypothetical protein M747DRAFT_291815 [Aspergillus niger ATCC 13496]RDK42134.1 hypothetical protein M752DRAFT_276781 [Aspergillus phoenicis ATCC 13157]KAI2815187.1 hypothetical protein CBS115989_7874 [Aspergillus niger]KAI2827340.1 hypothetical protein CBS133816_6612 [Asper|eukprot:XP_001399171.1 hypothetical protein ANI_1_2134024 [Aspergillus niger CBS 513.88]
MRIVAIVTGLVSLSILTAAQGVGAEGPDEFTALGCPDTTKPQASQAEQLAAWDDFTNLLYTEKRLTDAFTKYVATGYINHSPLVSANGIDTTLGELSGIVPNVDSQLQHVFVGWDKNGTAYGTAHTKVTGNATMGIPNSALVDMIRMVGTCLVEHYDVQQAVDGTAPNPIAFF